MRKKHKKLRHSNLVKVFIDKLSNLIDDYLGIPNKKTNDKILKYSEIK